MSTKSPLAQSNDNDAPAWQLYEDVFDYEAVYLRLRGAAMELSINEAGQVEAVVRLPIKTAGEIGRAITETITEECRKGREGM